MTTTNTAANSKFVGFVFGSTLESLQHAVKRSGNDALVFLLRTLANDTEAAADDLAAAWTAAMPDRAVDHAMIEVVLNLMTKMSNNWFFRKRVVHGLEKAGCFPASNSELAA